MPHCNHNVKTLQLPDSTPIPRQGKRPAPGKAQCQGSPPQRRRPGQSEGVPPDPERDMRLVDNLVGWFLNDTKTWLRLAEESTFDAKPQYRTETREEQRLEPDGTTTLLSRIEFHVIKPECEKIRIPIHAIPPGYGRNGTLSSSPCTSGFVRC